jgi:hypothetical protein
LWLPGEALKAVIENARFRINPEKTHPMYRVSRQNVTGLVVNQKISVRWEYRHNVRAMVNSLVKTGQFELLGATQKDGHAVLEKRAGTLNELHGMLGFIDSIEYCNQTQVSHSAAGAKSSREKVYREFLIYTTFYAADKPVIICEGETDNVYLTHAIRSLAADFPALAEIMPDGKIRLKVRLYKYPRSSTARLLDLSSGGSSVLAKFIAAYKKETGPFTGPGQTEPVPILYDNDDGAKSIRNAIYNASQRRPTGSEPFVRVVKNLYAVPTPPAGQMTSSKIEDCFDAATKAMVIGGKSFNDGDGFDEEKHYGKKIFAHRVVRPKAEAIDFSGFHPLLSNLVAAMNEHKRAIAPHPPGPRTRAA